MVDRRIQVALPGMPFTGQSVQALRLAWMAALQFGREHLAEEVVITVARQVLAERDEEELLASHVLQ